MELADLHLLLNTLASSPTLRTSETWIPMCFPKFNPAGFVHAYISAVMDDVTLVFVSADREAFEDLRAWKDIVLNVGLFSKLTLLGLAEAASPFQKLEKDKIVEKVQQAIPAHPYGICKLALAPVRTPTDCPLSCSIVPWPETLHIQVTTAGPNHLANLGSSLQPRQPGSETVSAPNNPAFLTTQI